MNVKPFEATDEMPLEQVLYIFSEARAELVMRLGADKMAEFEAAAQRADKEMLGETINKPDYVR